MVDFNEIAKKWQKKLESSKTEKKRLKEENTRLRKEIESIKRKIPNKDWFVKTEELKSKISEYNDLSFVLITFFLTFLTTKLDTTAFKASISVILGLIAFSYWIKNLKENDLEKLFNKKKEAKSFIWKYIFALLIIIAYLLLIVWMWFKVYWTLWGIGIVIIAYLILKFTWRRINL